MTETDAMNESAMQALTKRATQLWWRCEAVLERIERRVKNIMESAEKPGTGIARTDTHCTDNSVRGSESAHVNINRIEVSERTLSIIAIVFSTAALMAGFWAINESSKSERESRLLQQQVMDQNALLMREGLRQPTDFNNGPAGNTQYQRKER